MKSVAVNEKISRVSNAVTVDFAGKLQALVQEVYVHQLVNVNEAIKTLITEFCDHTLTHIKHPAPHTI